MSFLQKALKVLQEFPNLINEPFQVADKKKKSFLHEAESFFKNLISKEKSEEVFESEDDFIQVDLDQPDELVVNEDLPQDEILEKEKLDSFSYQDHVVPTPIVPEEFDDEDSIVVELEPDDDDEPLNSSLSEFDHSIESSDNDSTINETPDDGIEISSLDNFEDIKLDSIDEFTGDTETVNLNEVDDSGDEAVIIEPEELDDSDSKDILEDWEKDAIAETVSDDPFLEADTDKLHEDVKEAEEILNSLNQEDSVTSDEPLVDINVEAAFETAKQFKSSYEEKLESYLVLFEITKELLKSKSFNDFFENLMYSIIGQVGPEIMIIFSSRDGNFSQMKIVAHEGIDIEPDYVIKKGDTLYSLLESEKDVVYAKDLLAKDLKDRERVLLENPLTEILIPIRVMDQFSGFIVAGKMISGEEYTEKDFEFLQILVEVSGNFLSKLFDSENLSNEVSELNKIIHSSSSITDFTDKVYTSKTLDELYDIISENLINDFKISNFTFMILDVKTMDYKVFGSNFLLPETLSKFRLSKDSKIITMISQVSDVYRLENFQSNAELNATISEQELSAMNEFTVIPLINIGRMVGLFIIHKVSGEWSPGFKRTILSLSNIVAPIIANLVMQNEKESLFRNPFNPLQETIDREIKYSETKNKQFTLIVLKILNVTRILNILGINFFSEYSDFISKKIFENTKASDYVSRIGQGKFAILLKENSKADSESFISKIKSEIVLFHNPSHDFKLSIQIYSLTYPEQAKDKRKFIEMMEET
jgi:GGDEF domain-containing protein